MLDEVFAILNIRCDKQVKLAVPVVVKPNRGRMPAVALKPGLLRYVGKSTIAIVAVKDILTILRDEQINIAIAVVVSRRGTHPKPAASHTGDFCHVRESAVPIVAIQRILQRLGRREEVGRTAVDKVEIHPTIAVIVEDGDPGTHRLRQMPLRGFCVAMPPGNSGPLPRPLFKTQGRRLARQGGGYDQKRDHSTGRYPGKVIT